MTEPSIFREYDIRGIIDTELNEQSVKQIGYHLGRAIQHRTGNKKPYIAIGYDAREHGRKLFSYLSSGLNHSGCHILNMGMVATGVNYFSNYQTFEGTTPHASVMITGSHNPSQYNGFKITVDKAPFFKEDIYTLRDQILSTSVSIPNNDTHTTIDVKTLYIDYMVNSFSHLKGLNTPFICDCGNGVANTVLSTILDQLELNYTLLYGQPDGTFPHHHPDPSDEKNLRDIQQALQGEFEYGFAYDGDADRIAFLTKKHNVKGDIMALLFAKQIDNPTVIGEVKCTQLMYDLINQRGRAIMYKTGHSNLKVKLKQTQADLAAEVSGHLFFNDRYFGFDDAIYATLRLLELIHNGINIDQEIDQLPKLYSTSELPISTTEEEKFLLMDKIKELLQTPPDGFPLIKDIIDIDGVRVIFDHGWGLVRASNTTPILVTRFEATSQKHKEQYQYHLNAMIKKAQDAVCCDSV